MGRNTRKDKYLERWQPQGAIWQNCRKGPPTLPRWQPGRASQARMTSLGERECSPYPAGHALFVGRARSHERLWLQMWAGAVGRRLGRGRPTSCGQASRTRLNLPGGRRLINACS
jgi:hypothetical protein